MNRRKNNSTVPRRLLSLGAVAALPLGALVTQAPASAETARESAVDSLWNVIGNDWDLDGLSNTDEQQRGTDPHHPDSDGDGLADGHELRGVGTKRQEVRTHTGPIPAFVIPTNPFLADSDGDGLTDSEENREYTRPDRTDTDDDGLTDAQEVNQKLGKGGQSRTCALSKDTDFDGIGDGDEVAAGTDPNISDKPNPRPSRHDLRDHDGDCMPDWVEFNMGANSTDYWVTDTDDDGAIDSVEVFGYGNADWADYSESQTRGRTSDSDGDGLLDGLEFSQGTDANSADTDGDGFTDSQEGFFMIDWAGETRVFQIDPLNPDQDKNGVPDGQEYSLDGMTRA